MELSGPNLKKNSYISGGNLQSLKNKNPLYFFSHFFVYRELLKYKRNISYTFPYKKAIFYQLKYFLNTISLSYLFMTR